MISVSGTDNLNAEELKAAIAKAKAGEIVTEPAALAVRSEPASLAAVIAAAVDKGMDPANLGKLLDLQERYEAGRAKQAYTRALTAAQAEMPPVFKDAQNSFNKTRYATLENVLNTVRPVYLRHGFALTFGQDPACPTPGMIRLFVDLSHADGHAERYYGDFPVDDAGTKGGSNKSAIQAVGSAFSYGRRYLIGLVFNLVFTNEDNDGAPIQPQQPPPPPRPDPRQQKVTAEQARKLTETVKAKGRDLEQLLNFFEADYAVDLLAWQYEKAMRQMGATP